MSLRPSKQTKICFRSTLMCILSHMQLMMTITYASIISRICSFTTLHRTVATSSCQQSFYLKYYFLMCVCLPLNKSYFSAQLHVIRYHIQHKKSHNLLLLPLGSRITADYCGISHLLSIFFGYCLQCTCKFA